MKYQLINFVYCCETVLIIKLQRGIVYNLFLILALCVLQVC